MERRLRGQSRSIELLWRDQVESIRRKCFAGLAKLRRLKNVLPSQMKKQICNVLVLPHLDYCCFVWQDCLVELCKNWREGRIMGCD